MAILPSSARANTIDEGSEEESASASEVSSPRSVDAKSPRDDTKSPHEGAWVSPTKKVERPEKDKPTVGMKVRFSVSLVVRD